MNQEFNNNNINENNNNLNNNSNINYQNNSSMNDQVDLQSGLNNSNVFNQTNSQQYSNTQSQNINNQSIYQQPNNSNNDNQNIDNNSKKKSKIGLVVIIIIILALIITAIYLITKDSNQHKTSESNKEDSSNTNKNVNNSTAGKYVIYLNDMKITLGETTMDYILKNTDLKVVRVTTTEGTCDLSDCTVEEDDITEIKLSDGVNNIWIESYSKIPNKTKSLATLEQTDDPAFDTSTGTKLVFVDNAIGKNINIGDSFTEDEYYNITKNTKTCFKSDSLISCSQTKLYGNDYFAYWLDDNYKIINMSVNLDNLNP